MRLTAILNRRCALLLLMSWATTVSWATTGAVGAEPYRQPVYVGVKVCASCHEGSEMGNQCSKWYLSRHAEAYTSLATPDAKMIARWSGIPTDPQQSAVCLGCHATGAQAEDWEKDATFFLRDGVQCEKCHGPGSEYKEVMTDPEEARLAGLKMPDKDDCLQCHAEKGSHRITLGPRPFEAEQAMRQIAHSIPKHFDDENWTRLSFPPLTAHTGPSYTGALACAECHTGAAMGFQYSKWRSSRHAEAYAVLSTPKAYEIAKQAQVDGDPQTRVECLKCHTTAYHRSAGGALDTYTVYEGVSCEACHGAGSDYSPEPVMKDVAASTAAGLLKVTAETCMACHAEAHGKPFDYESAVKEIAHPTTVPEIDVEPRYKTPINIALHPDGGQLYVTCEAAYTVIVVDTASRKKIAEIPVGGQPADVAFSPDGRQAFVSNRLDDTVSVIDTAAQKLVATIPVGDEPHGVLTDHAGKYLYVLNTASDDISVIEVATRTELKRLAASRNPWAMAISPDGAQILATNMLSRFVKPRTPSVSEVTVIDTKRAVVEQRTVLPATNLLQGVAWHPSGDFALVTMLRTKNVIPMTRILQGWTITNGLGIVWADGRTDQLLLDEPGICFPDPSDVAFTPDGRLAMITSATLDVVAVVDVAKMIDTLESASAYEREHVIPNHLGKATEYVIKRIPTKNSPRGIRITPDGQTAFVANAYDDSITVIDVERLAAVQRIDLGGPREITRVRRGERLFHNANITFHRQFSCHSCHPDGHVDGLTYDIEPDGIGVDPVDNRTLRGILDTAPFKWSGKNPSFSRQCGPRLSAFFTRLQPFTPQELADLDLYICTIPRPPNHYRPVGAPLTEAQRRGKAIFERTRANDGSIIPEQNRCATCHFPPLYTDRQLHDVGTQMEFDATAKFDVPHLNNIYSSAPYLHNGTAPTLEEIWTTFNPDDKHGVTNDMTKDQLNDLIEYLKTL